MWAPVVRELAKTFRVVVPDVPGFGESEPLESELDANGLGHWLGGLVAATGIESPVLVCHSLVGSLAVRAVANGSAPALGKLVVCAAPSVGPYRMPMKLRYLAIRFAIRPTAANGDRFDRFALLDRDATRQLDPDWYDAWAAYTQARARTPHVKRTMSKLIRPATRPMTDHELSNVSVPTALLWGRADRMVPVAVAETARRSTGWPLRVISAAAHAPQIEQPARFTETVRELASQG